MFWIWAFSRKPRRARREYIAIAQRLTPSQREYVDREIAPRANDIYEALALLKEYERSLGTPRSTADTGAPTSLASTADPLDSDPDSGAPVRPAEKILGDILARSVADLSEMVADDIAAMEAWLAAPMTRATKRHVQAELQYARGRSQELANTHAEMREAAAAAGLDISDLDRLVARRSEFLDTVRDRFP